MQIEVEINATTLKKLRKMRLWHWRQALHFRSREHTFRDDIRGLLEGGQKEMMRLQIDLAYSRANHHIGCVQTLNDFFPLTGDTAEHDADKEKVSTQL